MADASAVIGKPQAATNIVLKAATDIASHPLLVPFGSLQAADSSGSFYCEADGGGTFRGYASDGDFDLYVNAKCHGVTASTMQAHAALQAYDGHAYDVGGYAYGTNIGKDCSNTVVCGDSQANWACSPCDGTWSYHAVVEVVVPPDYYFTYAEGSCYLRNSHDAVCDSTGYFNISSD